MGDNLIRWTVWLALVGYLTAFLARDRRWTRAWWTLAFLAYFAHVAAAFHFVHGWSHERAYAHVEAESGFGPGIYVSYVFTLGWAFDVAWMWLSPERYAIRPRWWAVIWQVFMALILFNGAVIFAHGPSRWLGIAVFAALSVVIGSRLMPRKKHRGR